MAVISGTNKTKKPPRPKTKLCLLEKINLRCQANKDGKNRINFQKIELEGTLAIVNEIRKFLKFNEEELINKIVSFEYAGKTEQNTLENLINKVYAYIANKTEEQITLSIFIINEIKKFFRVRDVKLINHIVSFNYEGNEESRTLENWINKIDNDIINRKKMDEEKINNLEKERRRLENILTQIDAESQEDEEKKKKLQNLKQKIFSEKKAQETDIEVTKKDNLIKEKSALESQLTLIDEYIQPYFQRHLHYHATRIDYYWEKVFKLLSDLPVNSPTRDIEKLLRAVGAGETLLGRYKKKRDEIEKRNKALEELLPDVSMII